MSKSIGAGECRLRADLAQTLKYYLEERITCDIFDDAIRALEEENFIVATNHTVRIVTLDESNFD